MRSARSLLLNAALLCACSPALDWRQTTPAELGIEALFPCRPASMAREVPLLKDRARMVMHACSAAGGTYAVSGVMLQGVGDVTAAIESLRDAAMRNLGAGDDGVAQPFDVPGMTPNDHAGRFTLKGQRPDGSAVVEHLLLFVHGTRVYQASVVASVPNEAAVSMFFGGLKVLP